MPTHLGKGLSYAAGVIVGFVGNKLWAFESRRHFLPELLTHLFLYACTMLVNVVVYAGLSAVVGSEFAWFAFLGATGVTTVLNFLGMRWVTFRKGIHSRRM
jgi:putative flippase GtrA